MANVFEQFHQPSSQGSGNVFEQFHTPSEAKRPEGGLVASLKQTGGQMVKGAGQLAADVLPGVDRDNALTRTGQGVIDANPTAVHSLSDVADSPWTATKEAVGNAAASVGGVVGARLLGQGITAAAPLAGPAAPLVAGIGQGISWLGPTAMAALPSYGGIREQQIADDPNNEGSLASKALAGAGAATVGLIENRFGPQEWALNALSQGGRDALAKQFAANSLAGAIGKGAVKGAAIEGAEEIVQNPIEQLASYQDPRTAASLQDTAFGGVMGALGGGVLGGGAGGLSRTITPSQPQQEQPAQPTQPAIDPNAGPLSKAASMATNLLPSPDQLAGGIQVPAAGPSSDVAQMEEAIANSRATRLAREAEISRRAALDPLYLDRLNGTGTEFADFVGEQRADLDARRNAPAWQEAKGVDAGFDPATRARNQVGAPTGTLSRVNELADLIGEERADLERRDLEGLVQRERSDLNERRGLIAGLQTEDRKRRDIEIADADRRTADAMQREAQARRREILDSVLAEDAGPVNAVSTQAQRFSAALQRAGIRDTSPSEAEIQSIRRAEDVRNARANLEPSAPNEMDAAAMGIRERAPRAQQAPRRQAPQTDTAFVDDKAATAARKSLPFATEQGAQKKAAELSKKRNEPFTVIPHPALADRFAVVPFRNLRTPNEQGQAAQLAARAQAGQPGTMPRVEQGAQQSAPDGLAAPAPASLVQTQPSTESVTNGLPQVEQVAQEAEAARGQEGAKETTRRVTRDTSINDGATVFDRDGKPYRVHYQRNDLVVAHPIINGKPQVSADTTVRFWTNKDVPPSGERDRTDPIYPASTDISTDTITPNPAPAKAKAADTQFDVSTRTDDQLRYLTVSGKPGWKEAAQTELARRQGTPQGERNGLQEEGRREEVAPDTAATDAAVNALSQEEAKAVAARLGKKIRPSQNAYDAIKQEHPDDIKRAITGDTWNGKQWTPAKSTPTTPEQSPSDRFRAEVERRKQEREGPQQAQEQPKQDAYSKIDPLQLTPKQYHEAKLQAAAKEYGLPMSEVREMQDDEGDRQASEQQWVNAVKEAFRDGKELNAKTLDKLEEVRPGAFNSFLHDHPNAKVPEGYQTPQARQIEKQRQQDRKDDRKAAREERQAEQPESFPVNPELESLFESLDGTSTRKANKAKKAIQSDPRADKINMVQDKFLDILQALEDSGAVKINCK